jgi:copper oxidase (laccase) domain-containing protein
VKQVHGTSIRQVNRLGVPFSNHGIGDALVTSDEDLGLTIRTADCLPLFLFSQSQIVLVHVGYRGLLDGILYKLEQEVLAKGKNKVWNAAIGSHIGICCFQVTGPILEQFNAFSLVRSHDIIGPERAPFVSLKNIVFHWFQQVSGGRSCFDFSTCTHCRLEQHSYRRSKTANRLGHVIFRESKKCAP